MFHETSLRKRTNASGAISDWAYTDLMEQRVNFGYHNSGDGEGLAPFTFGAGRRDADPYGVGVDGECSLCEATFCEDVTIPITQNAVGT